MSNDQGALPGSRKSADAPQATTREKRRGSFESSDSQAGPATGRRRGSKDSVPEEQRPRRKSAEEIRYVDEVQSRSAKTHLDRLKYTRLEPSVNSSAEWRSDSVRFPA